jgi:hypothetical protein
LTTVIDTSGRLSVDNAAALVAGMGALVLAAGTHEGHLVAG